VDLALSSGVVYPVAASCRTYAGAARQTISPRFTAACLGSAGLELAIRFSQ